MRLVSYGYERDDVRRDRSSTRRAAFVPLGVRIRAAVHPSACSAARSQGPGAGEAGQAAEAMAGQAEAAQADTEAARADASAARAELRDRIIEHEEHRQAIRQEADEAISQARTQADERVAAARAEKDAAIA